MKEDVKERWIKALRSGEYLQAYGAFTIHSDTTGKPYEYCCLAVLTDLAIKEGAVPLAWDSTGLCATHPIDRNGRLEDADFATYDAGDSVDFSGQLPMAVAEWAGLDESNPIIDGISAITRNDSETQSYEEIADAIEGDKNL